MHICNASQPKNVHFCNALETKNVHICNAPETENVHICNALTHKKLHICNINNIFCFDENHILPKNVTKNRVLKFSRLDFIIPWKMKFESLLDSDNLFNTRKKS